MPSETGKWHDDEFYHGIQTASEGKLQSIESMVRLVRIFRKRLSTDELGAVQRASWRIYMEILDPLETSQVLAELRRVLRDEGRVCIAAMSQTENPGWLMRSYEWLHHRFPNLIDCRPIGVDQVLNDYGFQVTRIARRSMWGLPIKIVLATKRRGMHDL